MRVLKFGGSCLDAPKDFQKTVDVVSSYIVDASCGEGIAPGPTPVVVVVSAVKGVTGTISAYISDCVKHPEHRKVDELVTRLRDRHTAIADLAIESPEQRKEYLSTMDMVLIRAERLLHGMVLTEELTPRTRDLALSVGERLSAPLLSACLVQAGVPSRPVEADKAGLITDGEFGNASVDISQEMPDFRKGMERMINSAEVPVLTGYFGADTEGRVTTFGRGGTDYSAAVVAAILGAGSLDIWKDVDGFMTADPKIIPTAKPIERLSYQEAAELAYFGAKVIHPRTVEPLRERRIPIRVFNTFGKGGLGTVISMETDEVPDVIKSVAYTTEVAVLKVHGVGVGFKPGVLNKLAGACSEAGINIKSVITSQTCISLLLEGKDIAGAHAAIKAMGLPVVERLEVITEIALVGIVGEGIVTTGGLAARAFSSVAEQGVNVLMISAGASSAAYYFVVSRTDIDKVVRAVHDEFIQ